MNSRLRWGVVAVIDISFAFLLVAFEATAAPPPFLQPTAISPASPVDGTGGANHHKEPVIIIDRYSSEDRRAVAWMQAASTPKKVNIKVWIPGNPATGEQGRWGGGKELVQLYSDGSGDPYFALNPVTHEVVLVTVDLSAGDGLDGIRLWTGKDFGADWCTSECIQPTDFLDSCNEKNDGMLVCPLSQGDKPSVTFSPAGTLYIVHKHHNNLHVQRWEPGAVPPYGSRTCNDGPPEVGAWSGFTVGMPAGVVIQSPIILADAAETIWVVAEDIKNNKIYLWSAEANALNHSWTLTRPEDSPPDATAQGILESKAIGPLLSSESDRNVDTDIIADSMLMARYNGLNDTIGIVWHERKGVDESQVRFVSFDTRKKKFGCSIPVTNARDNLSCPTGNEILLGLLTPTSEFHPAIEVDSLGHYLVTYYNTPPGEPTELKVARLSRDGGALWDDEKPVPESESNPRGYNPPIGEYQDISYSAVKDTWYASFIKAGSQIGDTHVTEMNFRRFFRLIEHGSGDPAGTCTALPAAVEITAGESIPLCAPEGTSWEWHLSSARQPHHFFSGQRIEWVSPTIDTTYWVKVDDGEYSEPVHVTVASCVPPTISAPDEYTGPATAVAVGSPVNVAVTASGTSLSYAWHLALVTGNGIGAWSAADLGPVVSTGPSYTWTPSGADLNKTYGLYVVVQGGCNEPPLPPRLVQAVQTVDSACPNATASGGLNRAVQANGCPSLSKEINAGESVTLAPPEWPQGSFEWEWYRSDQSGSNVNFAHVKSVAVSPTVDTSYWVTSRYTADGVVKEERSFNIYILVSRTTTPGIQLKPRFQVVSANAGALIEVVDTAVPDRNFDRYKFEWFQTTNNSTSTNVPPLAWSFPRLPLGPLNDDVSFWCRVTDPDGNETTTNVATVAVTCTDGLRGSLQVAPGNFVSRTDRPVVSAYAQGKWLRYDWFERLPGETTPRLYYKHGPAISPTPAQPLTYYSAKIQDACGQTASLSETPVYLCLPTIDSQPVDQIVPRGGSASLTVAASPAIAGQALATTWRSVETGQVVGSGPTLSVTPAPGTTQTFYADVSADCSGTTRSVQTRIATVTGCELAATAYSDRNVAPGQTVTLTASISGAQAPSDAEYTWYYGSAPGTEYASGVGLWAITPPTQTTTTYRVRVKDGTCTANSNPVTVRVCVPVISSQPQGKLIRAGQTASLSVGVTPLNNETLYYQWYAGAKGDVTHPVSGATSSTFTTPALSATTSYWVRVTSSCGATTDSAAVVVTVCNNPVISSVTPTRYIRYGGSASHQVSATGNNLTYQWYTGSPGNTSSPLNGATLSSISQSPSTTTTYWARVASYGLCTADSPAMVIDVCTDPPITTQPASKTINSGQSATLAVATSATGATYQWYLGTNAIIQGATSSSLTVTPTADTQYFAQVTRGACTSTSNTATVTVCSLATSLSGGTNIAFGQSATLTATESGARSQPTNYEWYAGTGANSLLIASGSGLWQKTVTPSVTTQYWVRISDGICTADSSPVTVSVCKPTITAQPQGKTVNSGQTATLSVTATGAPLSYQWYIGAAGNTAQPIAGATSASYTTPPMSATTSYWVRVTGCTTADSVAATINVCAPPTITSGPTADSQRIPGTIGKMTVTATGTGLNYQWFTGQSGDTTVPVAGSGCNTAQCSFTLSSSKYYWVRIIGTCGTLNSPAVIHPVSPTIVQQPQSASVPPNATPTLSVGATGTDLTYQWYRGATGNTATPMNGATAATFTVPAVTAPVSYWCKVTSVGDPTAIAYSAEAALSFCTGPSVYGPLAQYLGYNQWRLGINVEEQDLGNVGCAWYIGVPGNVSQSVFQYEGGTYTNVTATSTQTWWCRAWYSDHSCYTDTGGATIYKVQ